FFDPAKISGGRKLTGTHQLRDSRWFDMVDISLSAVQQLNLFGIDINAQHRHAGAGELDRERQSYITKAYNSYFHYLVSATGLGSLHCLFFLCRICRIEKAAGLYIGSVFAD